jgi:UDP-2-acetamido-2-deoxy-ribo-hexuluronate aminotransferase
MNDLGMQYLRYKDEIDTAIQNVIHSGQFIKGSEVATFESNLSNYLDGAYTVSCGNGTDALQIALMALDLKEGDEVITTPFTFAATAETICLLKLKPVFVDIRYDTFCIDATKIEEAITPATKCIIPVHLFGTHADMDAICQIATRHNLYIIEDAAQSLGSQYTFHDGRKYWSGTMGHIGTTSFFPSKNLGCFGDGGALITKNEKLAEKIRMICNHGAKKKYYHEIIGVNSRLDALQAAILNVKLKYLDKDLKSRIEAGEMYNTLLTNKSEVIAPSALKNSNHTYHQYTIRHHDRDQVIAKLNENGVSSMIYYPVSLHEQPAFIQSLQNKGHFPETERACHEVLSLPIYPDITTQQIHKIVNLL